MGSRGEQEEGSKIVAKPAGTAFAGSGSTNRLVFRRLLRDLGNFVAKLTCSVN